MTAHCDVLIIGGGPGGLACAQNLASAGVKVLVVDQKTEIGPKVCAGGITWDGLIKRVPEQLIERAFCRQIIVSNLQRITVTAQDPIIATVNRAGLGQWMTTDAVRRGAEIITACHVEQIIANQVLVRHGPDVFPIQYRQALVGADGSTSLVRRYLKIPSRKIGIGLNYQIPANYPEMEWHLNQQLFGYGYGWIFPHADTVSVGAYGPRENLTAGRLKENLLHWAAKVGFDLREHPCRAALINFDYQGFQFGNTFLVGDAAGLASGLTGEGIYPAIVSGEAVARRILDPSYPAAEIDRLVAKQRSHHRVIRLAHRAGRLGRTLLMESLVFMLRLQLINFHQLEMTD